MRPEFGCAVWSYLFDVVDANTLGEMARAVTFALARWEPRIIVENVDVVPEPDQMELVNIHIEFTIKDTNDRRNLVYPFYVIPMEGEA